MYCSNCGTKEDEGSKFCGNCGGPLGTTQSPRSGQDRAHNKSAFFVLAGLAALAVALGTHFLGCPLSKDLTRFVALNHLKKHNPILAERFSIPKELGSSVAAFGSEIAEEEQRRNRHDAYLKGLEELDLIRYRLSTDRRGAFLSQRTYLYAFTTELTDYAKQFLDGDDGRQYALRVADIVVGEITGITATPMVEKTSRTVGVTLKAIPNKLAKKLQMEEKLLQKKYDNRSIEFYLYDDGWRCQYCKS